ALMHSHLELQSKLGSGSTFYFDITLQSETEHSFDTTKPPTNKAIVPSNPSDLEIHTKVGYQILIVDDIAVNLLLAKAMIKSILPQAQCIEGYNGREALTLFQKHRPALVLMDVQMPEINGYDATQNIRQWEQAQQLPPTPIIALTAGIVKGEKEKCIAVGMNDYLSKPITQKSIANMLTTWLLQQASLTTNQDAFNTLQNANKQRFNKKLLQERLEYDQDFITSLLEISKASLLESATQLQQFTQERNKKSIYIVAHQLKGIALNCCFEVLEGELIALETICTHDQPDFSTIAKIVTRIVQEVEAIQLLQP
ncbi:MAG: response regulator, partial [Thermoflexibacteraceae bacterium]